MLRPLRLLTILAAFAVPTLPGWSQARATDPGVPPLGGTLGSLLMPKDDVRVVAPVAGIITQIHIADGASVKKGEPLISLDSRMESAELAASEAALRGAEAEFERATNDFRRIKTMRDELKEVVSEKDFDGFATAVAITASRRDSAAAAVTMARERLKDRTICSPINGVFIKTIKPVGEAVERFEPIARVVDPSVLELTIYCDTSYLGRFANGQSIEVQVQNASQNNPTVTGKVRHVDPLVDTGSGTFRVIIVVKPTESVVAGLHALLVLDKPTTTAQK